MNAYVICLGCILMSSFCAYHYKEYTLKTALVFGVNLIIDCLCFVFLNEHLFFLLVLHFLLAMILLQYKHQVSILVNGFIFLSVSCLTYLYLKYQDLFIILLLIFLFLLVNSNERFIRKTYEESVNDYQNKILKKQVDEVQNIYLIMRGWRHDYHNHLQTLKAHLKMNQIEQARLYLNELENDLDDIHQFIETGNVHLDAILNSKLSLASKQEIRLDYKASVPSDLSIQDIDLCVILGNLIDNAVEACEKLPPQERFIRLYIGLFKQQLYISVTNATNEYTRKLDEEYISTKRGNHGHGLKRINRIVEKYEGYINRQNEPHVFVTEILLPL